MRRTYKLDWQSIAIDQCFVIFDTYQQTSIVTTNEVHPGREDDSDDEWAMNEATTKFKNSRLRTHFVRWYVRRILRPPLPGVLPSELFLLLDLSRVGVDDLFRATGATHVGSDVCC